MTYLHCEGKENLFRWLRVYRSWTGRFASFGYFVGMLDPRITGQGCERVCPFKKGRCGTMTHDYKRNGTTTLFAARHVLEGTVVGECMPRHRHQEFLRFMRRLDREFPPDLNLHLILENYGTHKHLKMKNWLAKHRRFQLHFTPTSSSWPNLVKSWFGMGAGSRRVPGREQQTPKSVHLDGHGRADLGEGPSFVKLF